MLLKPHDAHEHFKMRILTAKTLHHDPVFLELLDLPTPLSHSSPYSWRKPMVGMFWNPIQAEIILYKCHVRVVQPMWGDKIPQISSDSKILWTSNPSSSQPSQQWNCSGVCHVLVATGTGAGEYCQVQLIFLSPSNLFSRRGSSDSHFQKCPQIV